MLFGGLSDEEDRGSCAPDTLTCSDTWEWGGPERGWTQRHPETAPSPLYGHGMLWDPEAQRVLLSGGRAPFWRDCGAPGDRECDETWAWDGETWAAVDADPRPPRRGYTAAAWDPGADAPLVFGGRSPLDGLCGPGDGRRCNDAWRLEGAGWHAVAAADFGLDLVLPQS